MKENDTVVIWGTGRIGQSILQAAKTKTGNTIICIDIIDSRLEIAKQDYPDIVTVNLTYQNPFEIIKEVTNGRGVDIAFEVVGHAKEIEGMPNPVRGCIQSIRGAGIVCVLGLGDEVSPILVKELIWKEAKIVASRVNHGEYEETIEKMVQGVLKPDSIISTVVDAKDAQEAFEMLEKEPDKYLKVLLKVS